ncbi:MAG: peptidase S8 [Xanthomonadaceae bacterium]|nr:peptidase S8 [Xanthomonadaceae bacterium]
MALDHLLVAGYTDQLPFKSTLSVQKSPPPQRDRATHGQRLLAQLAQLRAVAQTLGNRRAGQALGDESGMAIVLEIQPPGSIDFGSQLEWKRDGIEVLTVVSSPTADTVAVHVPDGKLSAFESRIRAYLTQDVKSKKPGIPDKPKNASLVNAIMSFRRAAFQELWTDDIYTPPAADVDTWFQVWLRVGPDGPRAAAARFQACARRFQLTLLPGFTRFQGRVVVAVHATRTQLEDAVDVLDQIAEIRAIPLPADFFLAQLKPYEQASWVQNLLQRTTVPAPGRSPYVTLLDTGVNHGHPLLAPLVAPTDLHAVTPAWGVNDHHGHGTEMAGLATHGELGQPLAGRGSHVISHRLESVKILPPRGQTPVALYGWVTNEAVRLVERADPNRRRTFAMMTTTDGKSIGTPSDWSAAIDTLAFGMDTLLDGDDSVDDRRPRLFVLAAGNIPWDRWKHYPAENDLAAIQNPAQAWNALTVGACTDLVTIDANKWPSLAVIAGSGSLAPMSTTSLLWSRVWPFKPDVVAEGGNGTVDAGRNVLVGPESLRLMTTGADPARALLVDSGETSGAAAEVSRLCAQLAARYPNYWPETIRALVVHGAEWTPAMRGRVPLVARKNDKEELLRRFGYGKIDGARSVDSEARRPTLILQESITPYVKKDSSIALGALNLHDLPWPASLLTAHPNAEVRLKLTLSYFIEPNPSRRGWQSKFRYPSHGLRFAVKGASETDEKFMQRINKLDRDELLASSPTEEESDWGDPDARWWALGAQLRSRGSIHSDTWSGTAAQLALKSHIAVFPVGGWWKDWRDAQRYPTQVRYALVVSLEATQDIDIDLYTPIANQIGVAVPVAR